MRYDTSYVNFYKSSKDLAHSGILGMHWGVRHGPPYPLSNDARSSSERRQNPTSESAKEKYGDDGRSTIGSENYDYRLHGVKIKPKGYEKASADKAPDKLFGVMKTPDAGKAALQAQNEIVAGLKNIVIKSANKDMQEYYDKIDLSNIPSKQLQDTVNRINLERNYLEATYPGMSEAKKESLSFLNGLGKVLGFIGTAGLAIVVLKVASEKSSDGKKK